MYLNSPIIFADGQRCFAPHSLKELVFIARLAAILPPLIDLKGKEDTHRDNREFDRDAKPVTFMQERYGAPQPSRLECGLAISSRLALCLCHREQPRRSGAPSDAPGQSRIA